MGLGKSAKGDTGAMNGWTGIHSSMLNSSIWQEPHTTFRVWITLLLMSDANGIVDASVPGLARQANVTIEEAEAALKSFMSPDPYSRTKDYEGRRIEEVDGGWKILNYLKHRNKLSYGKRSAASSSNGNSPNGTHTSLSRTNTKPDPSPGTEKDSKGEVNANSNTNTNSGSSPIGEVGQTSEGTSEGNLDDFSPAEREAYSALSVDRQRKSFLIIRGWAARAAANGENDFKVSQKEIAKQVRCDERNVSDIIRKLRELGAIEQTAAYVVGQTPSRYRWALDTTLPIPGHNPDSEEEPLDL
jgi:hypothetical protein